MAVCVYVAVPLMGLQFGWLYFCASGAVTLWVVVQMFHNAITFRVGVHMFHSTITFRVGVHVSYYNYIPGGCSCASDAYCLWWRGRDSVPDTQTYARDARTSRSMSRRSVAALPTLVR